MEQHTQKYAAIDCNLSDKKFFQDNLLHSIDLKFSGDKKRDNAIYRIAASSISASVEDLISLLLMKFVFSGQYEKLDRVTLGQKLDRVYSNTDIIFPLLSLNNKIEQPKQIKIISNSNFNQDNIFYYGLDGDDTGLILEELFIANSDQEKFKQLSQSVKNAIAEIIKFVREKSRKSTIIFDAGDDLLFKGKVSEEDLKRMQEIYYEKTSGLTCSIGYGRSFQEVYLALKLAKTQPGKNAVVGIQLV